MSVYIEPNEYLNSCNEYTKKFIFKTLGYYANISRKSTNEFLLSNSKIVD